MPNYDTHIHMILAEVGNRGLNVRKITLHVYNAINTLFEPADKKDVHDYVLKYLRTHIKGRNALIERVSHGVYRFNPKSPVARQIKLSFKKGVGEEENTVKVDDKAQLLLDF